MWKSPLPRECAARQYGPGQKRTVAEAKSREVAAAAGTASMRAIATPNRLGQGYLGHLAIMATPGTVGVAGPGIFLLI